MKASDIARPDKVLLKGLKTLTSFSQSLYSDQKSESKAKAEVAFIGEKKMAEVQTQLYCYNKDSVSVEEDLNLDILKDPSPDLNYWLNFHGIHEVSTIQEIGGLLDQDRLTVRQILDTTLRSKVEKYEGYLFLSIKSILKNEAGELNVEDTAEMIPNFLLERDHKM